MKNKFLIGLIFLISSAAHGSPDYCASVSVEQDDDSRYLIVLSNQCDKKVYVSYCYANNHGGKWDGRDSASPGTVEKDSFYSPVGQIEYRMGWSWNEARVSDCQSS